MVFLPGLPLITSVMLTGSIPKSKALLQFENLCYSLTKDLSTKVEGSTSSSLPGDFTLKDKPP